MVERLAHGVRWRAYAGTRTGFARRGRWLGVDRGLLLPRLVRRGDAPHEKRVRGVAGATGRAEAIGCRPALIDVVPPIFAEAVAGVADLAVCGQGAAILHAALPRHALPEEARRAVLVVLLLRDGQLPPDEPEGACAQCGAQRNHEDADQQSTQHVVVRVPVTSGRRNGLPPENESALYVTRIGTIWCDRAMLPAHGSTVSGDRRPDAPSGGW